MLVGFKFCMYVVSLGLMREASLRWGCTGFIGEGAGLDIFKKLSSMFSRGIVNSGLAALCTMKDLTPFFYTVSFKH